MKKLTIFLAMLLVCAFSFAAAADDDDLFGDSEESDSGDDGAEDADGEFDDDDVDEDEDEGEAEGEDNEAVEIEEDTAIPADFKYHRVGALLGGGLGLHVGEGFEATKPKFVMGFTATYDYWFSPKFALALGLGFTGKGTRASDQNKTKWRHSITYMEIPLGVKLNVKKIIIGAGIAMDLAIKGTTKNQDNERELDWSDNSMWDSFSRFNLSGKIFLGYEFEVGPLYLVPGVDWSMQMLNDVKEGDAKTRFMNILFCVSAQFGL